MSFKNIKSNEGNAYIFVLVVVMTVSIVISIILNLTEHNLNLTNGYKSNAYLYEQAVHGVEDAISRTNKKLSQHKMYIEEKVLNDIFSEPLTSDVYYELPNLQNKYIGEFYLKTVFVNKFKKYAKEVLQNESYEYEIKDDNNTIKVEVDIYIDHEITVKCKTKKLGSDSFRIVEGKAEFLEDVKEILIPTYKWKEYYEWTNYGVYAKGDVIYRGELIYAEFMQRGYFNIFDRAFLDSIKWTQDNPIIVEKGFSGYIDISNFYIDNEPVKTAIIVESPFETVIYSSDPYKNTFEGIIYCKSDVTVSGINVKGTILSEQNLYLENFFDTEIKLEYDRDMLFKIVIENKELKLRLYDYFRATNFNGISKEKEDIQNILFKSQFTNNGTIIIDLIENLYYKITTIF